MKLSEAIRLGAMATPQGFGEDAMAGNVRCALGAAVLAAGVFYPGGEYYQPLVDHWPVLGRRVDTCPACNDSVARWAYGVVTHLNDDHRWPRERIADWVATIEPTEATEPLTPPVTDVTVATHATNTPKEVAR